MNALITIIRQKAINLIYSTVINQEEQYARLPGNVELPFSGNGYAEHICIDTENGETLEEQVLVNVNGSLHDLTEFSTDALLALVDKLTSEGLIQADALTTPAQDVAANLLAEADKLTMQARTTTNDDARIKWTNEGNLIRVICRQLQNC